MAAKIKEGLRDITQGVVDRFKAPKYADNLLGESLQDQLRKATAKELAGPNEELSSQVVDTINQDIANGKDSKEIVGLLKKRLRNDNPHKQWLAVLLVGRVMRDCAAALGTHQEELLQEVARVMARPARPDSSAGRTTRQAAKELLRSYGRAGTSAFRAVNRSNLESVSNAVDYTAAINAAVAREAAQVVEEVNTMIEQAQANTELLSEMLVAEQQGQAQGSSGGDDFENELTKELVTEVRELRSLFDAYLEQMQSMSDPAVEAIMIRALEAVDMLDGALALHQDVASNQRELEQQAAAGAGAAPGAGAGAGSGPSAAAARSTGPDLISLDDLTEALLPQPPPVLASAVPQPAAAAAAVAAPPPVAPLPAPASASVRLTPAPPVDPFADLDPVAIQAALSPTTSIQPPAAPGQTPAAGQPRSYANQFAAFPSVPQQQQPVPTQPYPYAQHQQPLPQQQQPFGAYAAPPAYGGAPAAASTSNPFAVAAVPTLPFGAATQPPAAAAGAASGNPFAGTAAPPTGNPFAAAGGGLPSPGNHAAAVDSEWSMFFASRTAGAAAAQQR